MQTNGGFIFYIQTCKTLWNLPLGPPIMLALSNQEFVLRHTKLGKVYSNVRKARRLVGSWGKLYLESEDLA